MATYRSVLGTVLTAAIAVAGAIVSAAPAMAQVYPAAGGVANVSVANGSVVIVRGDSGTQVGATINAPLLSGDYIATGTGSDAEVQFDGISMLRLAESTQVRIVNLNPSSRETQLASGTVDLAELQGADGSPQVDTPSLTVRPNQGGDYRVSVLGNGQTLVTVRRGSAVVSTGTGSQTLTPGTTLVAYGPYSNPTVAPQGAIAWDSFDQFNASRDQTIVSAYNSNPYLSPQLAGYANLANYGQWQDVPSYGYAWAPNNQTNFAPYQNGQWVSEPGYGYTWVPSQPWGYAPSHYGSWFNNAAYGGWLWQPPAYQNQMTSGGLASSWAPALVTFFLTGSNGGGDLSGLLSALLGGGSAYPNYGNANIGWIPLAPGEGYQPWYGQNSYPPTSVTNVTNITNIYNYYGNGRYYRGITMVPVTAWRAGNFRHPLSVRPNQSRQIVFLRGAIPIVPTTANLRYSPVAVVKRPIVVSRTFSTPRFAAKAPVVARFSAQQAAITRIASVKPKTVALRAHVVTAHPVYRPAPHPAVHPVTILKPAPLPARPVAPVHPRPVTAPAPRPVATVHPRPVTPLPPRPVVTMRPQPVATVPPRALATLRPRPVAPVHPRPVATLPPRPVATVHPRPVITAHPVPPKPKPQPPQPAATPANGAVKPEERGSAPPSP